MLALCHGMLGLVSEDSHGADAEGAEEELSGPAPRLDAKERYRLERWRDDARLVRFAAFAALILHPLGGLTDLAIIGQDWRLLPLVGVRLLASAIHLPILLACSRDEPPRNIEWLIGAGFVMSVAGGVLMPTALRPTSVASQGGPLLLIIMLYALVFPAWRSYKVSGFLVLSAAYLGIGVYWSSRIGYGGSHELITITIFLVALSTLIPRVNRRIEHTEYERFMAQDALSGTVEQLEHEVALRERRERALEQAWERAEQANRSKTSFMASVSHELRTPLVGILGVTELMRDSDSNLGAEDRERVELLRQSGDYLLGLVNDLLDYFKLEADKLELHEMPFSPRTLATAAIELVRPRAEERGLQLQLDLDPALAPWITGDSLRLQQIMLNLVGNSVKFTSMGFIAMRLAPGPEDTLVLEVEDTGIGMDAASIDTMFEPFEQGGDAGGRAQGTGLGLAITRRFVEQMGGTIEVESTLGEGTTVRVSVPLRVADTPVDAGAKSDQGEATRPLRVLIAEDNKVNAKVLVAMLRRMGHQTTVARDGAELLEHARQEPFDIVLTDVFMPVLDGIEATKRLRRLPGPISSAPVLALTADAFEERHDALRAAGIDDVVVKPVSSTALAEVLKRHTRQVSGSR